MFERFKFIFMTILILGLVAIGKIISIQYFGDEIVTSDDLYGKETLMPSRGSILSYDGRPLALSIPLYKIHWDSKTVPDSVFHKRADSLALSLSRLFGDKSKKAYKEYLYRERKKGNRHIEIGNRPIDYGELEELREFPIFDRGSKYRGGPIVSATTKRILPYGGLAQRTIGYINADGGGTGIELTYNHKLKGEPGFRTIKRIVGDEWIPANGEPAISPVDGLDIRTTIDVNIQEATETELRKKLMEDDVFEGGTAIVMDVKTGAIRGIANMLKKRDGTFDESLNYAISQATEPGSTLKLAALISLLEDGYITLDTPVDAGNGEWRYGGVKVTDTKIGGYGMLTAKEAFEKSSNIAFAKMITEAYEENPEVYVSRLHNMKLVEKLNLDIAGERYATITSPDDQMWSKSTLSSLGFGYALTLTPLHILTFYNAVANEGKMVKPYFIEDFEQHGTILEKFDPVVVSGSICSKSTIREVKKALRGVVENGTAKKCDDPRYKIAGKTGTARIAFNGRYEDSEGYRKHQASFAGYFPADAPQYSCIVVLYTGKTKGNFYGATWAGPVFKGIADKIFATHPEWTAPVEAGGTAPSDNPSIAPGRGKELAEALSLLPSHSIFDRDPKGWVFYSDNGERQTAAPISIEREVVPCVEGMGLKDALYLLENEGYQVRFSGSGRVAGQSPMAGESLKKGGTVILKLDNKSYSRQERTKKEYDT